MTHPYKWEIIELRVKKTFIKIIVFDKFMQGVTPPRA